MTATSTRILRVLLIAAAFACPSTLWAQLDPLLFLKTAKPNVLIVFDTRNAMLRDADNDYYDAFTYTIANQAWEIPLGVVPSVNTTTNYRRKYVNLRHADQSVTSDRFTADSIQVVGDLDSGYASFWARTRLYVARTGLLAAIQDNQGVARFGLLRMRQSSPAWGTVKNEGPVKIPAANTTQQSPTETGNNAKWDITRPTVAAVNGSLASVQSPLVLADSSTANTDVTAILNKGVGVSEALTPGGRDSKTAVDAPVEYMLDDAKSEAQRLITADTQCRNTIVLLVVGGKEGTTAASQNPASKASQFLNISGRRVPIYVIAIAPPAADVSQLQSIAANSGGQFFEITKAMIDATTPGTAVPEVSRAVNLAVQHAFASQTDFNTAPTALLPYGPQTEYQVTSPIVGTANLDGSKDIDGATLPNTHVTAPSGNVLPQRSNLMVTSAFALPGFEAKLRAFRVYRPVADSTKVAGYKFVADGTRLWVGSTPNANARNIFTVLPGASTLTPFTTTNASTLSPYLNTSDAAGLIDYVRSLPLGPVVSSTPAIMDPPSVDPPPDEDYPAFAVANEDRRGLVWVGTNDGMMHAVDARLGVEVWAFIPFNLLPKLKALRSGQPVDRFNFFVDSSPKIADVKIGSNWRTYLVFGEGAGGTFYQTFDVTMDGISSCVAPDNDSQAAVLPCFADADLIDFEWSFPSYSDFDYTISPYGDVSSAASAVAKSVGESWSDPAVGQIQDSDGKFAVLVGSGFLTYTKQQQSNRSGIVAGTTFYLLDASNGSVFDSVAVGSDSVAETVDSCATANDCTKLKNALQADPVATGPPDSRYITKAYIGDLDGRVWRLDVGSSTSGNHDPVINTKPPTKVFDNGAAHPLFSSMAAVNVGLTQQYVFFGTGSDLLPSNGVNHQYKLVGILDAGTTGTQKFATLLTKTDGAADDEKVTAFPAVAGDIVFFTTTSFKPATPCTAPDANLYALTFIGGPAYDNTGDNQVTNSDTTKVKTITGARASAPFIVDQHLVFSAGGKVEIFGDPQDYNNGVGQVSVRILSWREVR